MKKAIEIRQVYIKNKMLREIISSVSLVIFLYMLSTLFANEIYQLNLFQIPFKVGMLFLLLSFFVGTRNYTIFDFETGNIETIISYGLFKRKKVLSGDQFDYFSLIKDDGSKSIYQLNIWRKDYTHQTFYAFNSFSQALDFSLILSKKLNLGLLDATDLRNTKWINSPEL